MSIKVFIIDDEQSAINDLRRHADKIMNIDIVGSSTSCKEALDYIKGNQVDLLFLDFNMEPLNGLEFLKQVNRKSIFITAHKIHVFDALENENVIDYVTKPVQFDRLVTAVRRAEVVLSAVSEQIKLPGIVNECITLETALGEETIQLKEISYIEAKRNYSMIHCGDKAKLATMPLIDIESILPSTLFARAHKSHIVALKRIAKVTASKVVLDDNTELSIGRGYRDNVFLNTKK